MTFKIKESIYLTLLGFQALVLCFGSHLNPWSKRAPVTDSSVFLTIGKYMAKGAIPYLDMFDHKGPVLYIINWFGMLFGYTGVWIIEAISMVVAIFLCYKCARRFFSSTAAFAGTMISFLALIFWFSLGNMAEEYALPFLFGALYCLTGYFVQDFTLSRKQVLISGGCLGIILMLKANMIGLWIGMCVVIFVHTLFDGKYQRALNYVFFFVLGISVSVLPLIVWLTTKRALSGFWDCYIRFNMDYSAKLTKAIKVQTILDCINNYPVIYLVALIFLALIIANDWNKKDSKAILLLAALGMFLLSIIFSNFSGYGAPQYYIAMVPCLVLPFAWIVNEALEKFNQYSLLIIFAILLILNEPLIKNSYTEYCNNYDFIMRKDEACSILTPIITENTLSDDMIAVIGNKCNLYLESDRAPASYYIFTNAPFHIDSSSVAKYVDDLRKNTPTLIVNTIGAIPDEAINHILNNYAIIYENGDLIVYKLLLHPSIN